MCGTNYESNPPSLINRVKSSGKALEHAAKQLFLLTYIGTKYIFEVTVWLKFLNYSVIDTIHYKAEQRVVIGLVNRDYCL